MLQTIESPPEDTAHCRGTDFEYMAMTAAMIMAAADARAAATWMTLGDCDFAVCCVERRDVFWCTGCGVAGPPADATPRFPIAQQTPARSDLTQALSVTPQEVYVRPAVRQVATSLGQVRSGQVLPRSPSLG